MAGWGGTPEPSGGLSSLTNLSRLSGNPHPVASKARLRSIPGHIHGGFARQRPQQMAEKAATTGTRKRGRPHVIDIAELPIHRHLRPIR